MSHGMCAYKHNGYRQPTYPTSIPHGSVSNELHSLDRDGVSFADVSGNSFFFDMLITALTGVDVPTDRVDE